MGYHIYHDGNSSEPYGAFEVFHSSEYELDPEIYEEGWYWWSCQPRCMPDSNPVGPFYSDRHATADALGIDA